MLPSQLLSDLPDPRDCDLSEWLSTLKHRLCAIGCLVTDVRCVACGTNTSTFTQLWQDAGCAVPLGALTLETCADPVLWMWTGSAWEPVNYGTNAIPSPYVTQYASGSITAPGFPSSTAWDTFPWPIMGSAAPVQVKSGQRVIIRASGRFDTSIAPRRVKYRIWNQTLDRAPSILGSETDFLSSNTAGQQTFQFVAADDPGPGSYVYTLQARMGTTGYTTDTFFVTLSAFTIG